MEKVILQSDLVSKKYSRKSAGSNYFYAVKQASLTLRPETVTVLCGRSGSGKTTLLHMLSGLLTPSEGKVLLNGTDLYSLPDNELSRLRSHSVSVIPQGRSVLDHLTVMENMLLPRDLSGDCNDRSEALRFLEMLNIASLADSPASELSGGELRRTAIARSLYQKPGIILADEPTGDLDDENTKLVFQCFRTAASEGAAVFIVSHEPDAMTIADYAFRMDSGVITPVL